MYANLAPHLKSSWNVLLTAVFIAWPHYRLAGKSDQNHENRRETHGASCSPEARCPCWGRQAMGLGFPRDSAAHLLWSVLMLPFWGPLLLAGRSRAGQDLPQLTLGVCMTVFWVGFGRQDCHQAGALGMGETPSPQCPGTLLSSGSGAAGGRDVPHGCPVLEARRRTLVTCRHSAPLHSHQGPP